MVLEKTLESPLDCKDEQGTIALFMWFNLEITLVFDKEPLVSDSI